MSRNKPKKKKKKNLKKNKQKVQQTATTQAKGPFDSKPNFEKFLLEQSNTIKDPDGIFLLVHTYDQVQIGAVQNGNILLRNFPRPIDLIELRMFSSVGECRVWKTGGEFKNRFRLNEEELKDGMKTHDEFHFMWGTGVEKLKKDDNWLKLTEERKTDIYVPFKVEENMLPLKYKVINYIGFDDNGIAVFEDARLFGFFDKDENKDENRIKMPEPEII